MAFFNMSRESRLASLNCDRRQITCILRHSLDVFGIKGGQAFQRRLHDAFPQCQALPAHLLRQHIRHTHASSILIRTAQEGIATEDEFNTCIVLLLLNLAEPRAHLIEGFGALAR